MTAIDTLWLGKTETAKRYGGTKPPKPIALNGQKLGGSGD
jgi:hypothetical protein